MPRVYWMRTFSVMQKMKKKQTRLFGALLSRAAAPSFGLVEIKKRKASTTQCSTVPSRPSSCRVLCAFIDLFFLVAAFLSYTPHTLRWTGWHTHAHTTEKLKRRLRGATTIGLLPISGCDIEAALFYIDSLAPLPPFLFSYWLLSLWI